MADDSPTMRRRQLGAELRRLREEAGKTQDEVHQWTNVPATTISRMETGKRRVPVTFLKAVLQLYGVGSPHAEALEKLARESSERGWWAAYGDTVPNWFAEFLGMETAADELWTYESEYVPGILQTRRYTAATLL
jgi:transcriptional regulator with XRE-family HTH domain